MMGPIRQLGYLVEDLPSAMQAWIDGHGVGPWTEFRNVTLTGSYLGDPVAVRIHVGLGYLDGMQIELIQPVDDGPSPYRDEDGAVRVGAHHVAWLTDDLDAAVAEWTDRGFSVPFRAGNASTEVAYLNHPATPGTYYELICGASTADMIDRGVAAARTWDGSHPVTTVGGQ